MARSRRQVFRTAAAGITAAALAAISLSAAGPAQAAVTATVTVTTPAAVGPGQTFDVVVDVICPTATAGTGSVTADVQVGAAAAFGQVTDPNFETPALGTNPFHWSQTYTFTAPDLATLGGNSLDVTTTLTGRPCVNDTTGVLKTNTVLVADLPAAPTITSTTPGNGQATVTYTPVADPAGAPVTGYEYRVNGAAAVSAGLSNPFIAHGLINEVNNTIEVRAVNSAGAGPWSAAANVTAEGPPAVPTALAVTPGNQKLSITFSAPPTPINAIDSYQYSTDGGTTWQNLPTLSTAYDITTLSTNGTTPLTNGTTYNVQVRAHNSLGYGAATASVAGTPSTLPDAPNGISVTSSNGAVDLSFTAPANGGSPITDYLYSTDGGITFVPAGTATIPVHITTTSDTATPLQNGTQDAISIESVNANGPSAPTIPVAATPGVAPDKPAITTFDGDTAVLISATFNTDGGIPVTLAQCQLDGGAIIDGTGITADGVSASFVITGLTNGQTYSFACRVGNTAGYSAWSDAVSGTPAAAPTAPTLNSVVPGVNSLTVNFTPGFDGGSTVTGYSVYLDGVIYTDPVTNATSFASSPIVLTGLLNTDPHTITVTATNAVGESLPSNSIYSIVGQTLVAVTASSPSQITYGTSIPAITWSTVPATAAADWQTSQPTCAVYATADTTFSTPLTGIQNAGTYVTHCSGGAGVQFYPASYTNGSLIIAKASATNVISCPASVTYNNTAQTPCTSAITGVGLTNVHGTVTYANNTNAGTATASSTWSDANHTTATATNVTFTINKASATNVITCPASVTYDGTQQTPCTSAITGVGLTGISGVVNYAGNTNAGTATASSSWSDANHTTATATNVTFTINKATSNTAITCSPSSVTFSGSALTPCTATVTGPGTVTATASVTYTANTHAGTATANATTAGDTNHLGSTATAVTFTISKATSTTTVTCPASANATGSALTPCTATTTGVGGLNASTAVTYTNNVSAGTATATATFAGDTDHLGSTDSKTFAVIASVVVTASSPANITYNTVIPAITWSSSPTTIAADWSVQPTCAVYATTDTGFATPLTGVQNAGTYVTHCKGGTSTFYRAASYTDGHLTIDKATSTTTITCSPTTVTFNGSAQTPCTAAVSGAGTVTATASVTYTANTHAGTATANATTAGDTNHLGSTATAVTFTIAKAASTTVVTCPTTVVATGSALSPCTANTTGVGGLNTSTTVTYANNTNAGTATATATFTGDTDHLGSTDSKTFVVLAPVTVTAASPANITYGDVLPAITWSSSPTTVAGEWTTEPTCAVYASTDHSFNTPLSGVQNAGTYVTHCKGGVTSNYHVAGYTDGHLTIDKATSTTTITCPPSETFTGAAHTPCTAAVTGVGTITATATVVYASNTHAGTATANATTAGDSNHLGSTATEVTFDITKASSTTVVSCSGPVIATGTALTPCTATTTGAGGLNITTPVVYTDNVAAGTATATATFAGDADHDGSTASTTFTVLAPSAVVRPVVAWSGTNKAAARSYVKVLGTLGSPVATITSTSTSSCLIKGTTVYFLTAGTCQVTITQGGTTWKVLSAAVSKNNALAAPAKAQPLKTVGFAVAGTTLTAASKAQLDALLPTLRKSKIVIVYGFASGRGAIVVSRSRARAAAVTAYLTARGVTVASSAGYGSSIAPLGNAPKDRVDIAIG